MRLRTHRGEYLTARMSECFGEPIEQLDAGNHGLVHKSKAAGWEVVEGTDEEIVSALQCGYHLRDRRTNTEGEIL